MEAVRLLFPLLLLILCSLNEIQAFQVMPTLLSSALRRKTATTSVSNMQIAGTLIECAEGEFDNLVTKSAVPVVVDFSADW